MLPNVKYDCTVKCAICHTPMHIGVVHKVQPLCTNEGCLVIAEEKVKLAYQAVAREEERRLDKVFYKALNYLLGS